MSEVLTPGKFAAWDWRAAAAARPLAVLLPLAFAVRVAVALAFPNFIAPDEIYQALEQAHRLVFGSGIVPWEFQVGLRSWLIPGLLAGPMALARWIDPDPIAGLVLIRVLLCAAALPIVGVAIGWAGRLHGPRAAWVAGLVTAFWPDLWIMAPHPLEEVLATDLLIPALYLIELRRPGRVMWPALLLGLAFVVRNQLAPGIAVAGIFLCRMEARRWAAGLFWAAVPVLAAGMLDWATWGTPFRSFWLNVYLNVFGGVASNFGVSPWSFYVDILVLDWLWALPLVLFLVMMSARRLPAAGLLMLVTFVEHTIIPHKELRFIYPALALAAVLAAVEAGNLIGKARLRYAVAGAVVLVSGLAFNPLIEVFLDQGVGGFALALHGRGKHTIGLDKEASSIMPGDLAFTPETRMGMIPADTAGTDRFKGFDTLILRQGDTAVPEHFKFAGCVGSRISDWLPITAHTVCEWRSADTDGKFVGMKLGFGMPIAAKPFILPGR